VCPKASVCPCFAAANNRLFAHLRASQFLRRDDEMYLFCEQNLDGVLFWLPDGGWVRYKL